MENPGRVYSHFNFKIAHYPNSETDASRRAERVYTLGESKGAESRIGLSQEAKCAIDECQSNATNCRDVRIKCQPLKGREFLVTWLLAESEPLRAEMEDNDADSLAKTNQRHGTTDRF